VPSVSFLSLALSSGVPLIGRMVSSPSIVCEACFCPTLAIRSKHPLSPNVFTDKKTFLFLPGSSRVPPSPHFRRGFDQSPRLCRLMLPAFTPSLTQACALSCLRFLPLFELFSPPVNFRRSMIHPDSSPRAHLVRVFLIPCCTLLYCRSSDLEQKNLSRRGFSIRSFIPGPPPLVSTS